MKRYSAAVEAAGLVTLFRGIYKGVFFECTIICKWRKLLVVVIGIAGELYRGPARRGGGVPISPVWILKRLVSVFINACHSLSALPSLSQFVRGRLSIVAISFYVLLLLFGPSRLSEFTLAGPLSIYRLQLSGIRIRNQ